MNNKTDLHVPEQVSQRRSTRPGSMIDPVDLEPLGNTSDEKKRNQKMHLPDLEVSFAV